MNLLSVVLGLVAGTVGGMFGIGGGLIIVPALILFFGYNQKLATGTSLLAQLLPVGILGVWEYWRNHDVQVGEGLSIAVGLLLGAWIGSMLTLSLPGPVVKQAYGVFLVAVGLYFLFSPAGPARKSPPEPPAARASAER
jgi:uncharacterized membrane protein YfcA